MSLPNIVVGGNVTPVVGGRFRMLSGGQVEQAP